MAEILPDTSDTALVTGGAGFIGSHVVDALVEAGRRVVVLDDLSGGFRENVHPCAEFVEGSIVDHELVESVFSRHRIDYVYHLAAYAAESLSHFIRRFNYANNVIGSVNLINAAVRHSCKCFVFTSSIAVYGSAETPMHEDLVPLPEDPYGIAKYAVELDLRSARRLFGLDYIIFRPHNVYGERQNLRDPCRNVVGIFMNRIMKGLPCMIFGDGAQTRAFTHVADVAPLIAASVRYPDAYGQVFNIGSDAPCSLNELARMVQAAMGRNTGIEHVSARDEVAHAFCDHGRCRRIFGYEPKVPLADGLSRMARWATAAGARASAPLRRVEIARNLPSPWASVCSTAEDSAS